MELINSNERCTGRSLGARSERIYEVARKIVQESEFQWESSWQADLDPQQFEERDLLREGAWVILCSGFREAIVRRLFGQISLCFCDWESAAEISQKRHQCIISALDIFQNQRKVEAIGRMASDISLVGFDIVKREISQAPLNRLKEFFMIGDVTASHLAKNLGFEFAKNDRHISRLCQTLGYAHPHFLCDHISSVFGDSRQVVDITLWRAMEINRDKVLSVH